MPKRTNDYQQLVKLIQQAFAPAGAKITESVEHETPDGPREVDVQLESTIGIYRIKIAIEAKAESRPLDVPAIEQFAGKYRHGDGIHVDKVVIVSKAGFTVAAKGKAARSNMELLTLCEAHDVDWKGFIPSNATQTLFVEIKPHLIELKLDPEIPGAWQSVASEGRVLCKCHRRDFGSVRENAERMLKNHVFADPKVSENINKRLQSGGIAKVTFWHELNYFVDFRGTRYEAKRIWVAASWGRAKAPLRFSTWEQTDVTGTKRVLQHAVAEVLGKKFQMVLPDGLNSKRIAIDIRDLPRPKTTRASTK